MEKKLNRSKNKKHPSIPRTLERTRDVLNAKKNLSKYGNTLDGSKKFYIDSIIDTTGAFIIFASFNIIEMIEKNIERGHRRYLLDGTFKVTPKLFYQLLIISIEYKNDVIQFYIFTLSFSSNIYFSSNYVLIIIPIVLLDLPSVLYFDDKKIPPVLFVCV